MTIHPQPKPRARKLEKSDRAKATAKLDRAENARVRKRSGGRCEMTERFARFIGSVHGSVHADLRCCRRAAGDPHHLIKGYGQRNVGPSIWAEWKLATCPDCHSDIHNAVLVPVDKKADAATIIYERRN
ncbi:MAG: hypothetical protein ABII76_28625 [Pseudomonadota bacterium]